MVKYGLKTDYGWSTNAVYDSVKTARKLAFRHVLKYPNDKVMIWAWYNPYERYKDKGWVEYNSFTGEVLYKEFSDEGRKVRTVKQDGSLGVEPTRKHRKEKSLGKTLRMGEIRHKKRMAKKKWSPFGL